MTASPIASGPAPQPPGRGLTATQWLICVIAAIGFAFDIYELLMAQFIVRPALMELGGLQPGTDGFANWASALLYVPAIAGGIFGLLGGYLTDRLGRRRILTWSILLYAFSAFFAGFSTNLWMLLFFRCTTFVGVCVEFVAAVAWLAELFPEPGRREKVLGYTQAFSSIGGFLIAFANGLAVKYAASLPAVGMPDALGLGHVSDVHAAWRYTLMSGIIPAIPLILIRPFLPESPAWQAKKLAGTLRRPSIGALFSPALKRTTIVSTIMMACCYAVAFGAIQQVPQIVPGLPEVQARIAAEVRKLPTTAPAAAPGAAPLTPAAATGPSATAPAAGVPTEPAVSGAGAARAAVDPATPPAAGAPVAAKKPAPDPKRAAAGRVTQAVAADVGKVQELGGLVGRVVLAVLAIYLVSRRALVRVFQVPGLIIFPVVFAFCAVKGLNLLYAGIFLAGLVTVAQFSFWGNYLPRVYPVHLRGTGESFAANIGGRLIGTAAFAVTQKMAVAFGPAAPTPAQAAHSIAYTAAGVALAVTVIGFVASFFLPEPGPETEQQ
jgi:MFS family permease